MQSTFRVLSLSTTLLTLLGVAQIATATCEQDFSQAAESCCSSITQKTMSTVRNGNTYTISCLDRSIPLSNTDGKCSTNAKNQTFYCKNLQGTYDTYSSPYTWTLGQTVSNVNGELRAGS